jgi:tetratricopeptide (TPR) repeat protein
MDTGSKGPPLRLENLGAYLDDKLEHETQVLDLLIVAQARGQTNQELWDKLHSAALRDDRLSELAFAYEKLNQDRRVRIMPPANQAQIFLNAARFFVRALGDLDGAQAAFERVLSLVPGHPEAFEQLRRILEDKGERDKLIGLHLASVGPKTEKDTALEHLRAALALAVELDPDRASKIGQQILKLDPSDFEAIEAICASLESAGKFPELARALEQAVAADPPPTDDKRLAIRVRLLELYDDKVPEVERAAPHIEEVLAADKDNAVARRVAARLLQNKSVAARAAGALEKVYDAEGDRAGAAQMLALQIEHLRGPKKAEAQRRLGIFQHDDGDLANAFANFEAVLGIDPGDDEVRDRYVHLARELGKGADASKMLSRAAAAVKAPQVRARINLEAARFLAELGDPKRARIILHGVLEQAEGDVALEAARALRGLSPEPKALAPILEAISKATPDADEKLVALRELAALYETQLDDLASAIQARKRVLQLDPSAEPEELERLLEARQDWSTLAEVLEIRAGSLPIGDERRAMLMRAATLRVEAVGDREGATRSLLAIRADHGPARDIHALLLPLLDAAGDHEALIEALTSEIDLADEEERSGLLTRLAESLLATGRVDQALDALAGVVEQGPGQPRAREHLLALMRQGFASAPERETSVRLRAAQILAPALRQEEDATQIVEVLEVIADLDAGPAERLAALAEAHARVGAIGKDKIRALFLAGRGLREAVAHDVEQLPEWLDRIAQSDNGPSKAAVAETLASALRDRAIDHPNLARLAQRAGDAYATLNDLAKAIDAYRRVLELEPDNEEIIERIDLLLAQKGSPDERIELYRAALARPGGSDDRKRRLYLAIGGVQSDDLKRVDDAIETYREGLALLPADPELRGALLHGLDEAKRYQELYDELEVDRGAAGDELSAAELDLRLADVAVKRNDPATAVERYRGALAVPALSLESNALDVIDELARGQVDVPLMIAIAERRVGLAEGSGAHVEMLEQLGALFGDRAGDPARAAECFLEAGELCLSSGDTQRAARAFERVLAYQPTTRLALERLLGIHAESGDKPRLLDNAERLIKLVDEREEAIELLDQLTDVVAESTPATGDLDRLATIAASLEERFGRSAATVRARAKILVAADKLVEAAEGLAALLGEPELRDDAATLLHELLDGAAADEALFPVRRALLEHEVAVADPSGVRERRLALLAFERDVANDASKAAAVLDALLEADPDDDEALVARQRLAEASGDFVTAARCLERRHAVAPDDDQKAARAGELGRMRLFVLKDGAGALDAVEELAVLCPADPVLREIALAAVNHPDQAGRASALLVRAAEGIEAAPERASIYAALFERADRADDPSAIVPDAPTMFRAWLDSLEDDPKTALDVASRAASMTPGDESFWDKAEELARSQKAPDRVAKAYRDVLGAAKRHDEDVIMRVGERGVAFHEEWFDDAEVVTGLLRQVVEAAPAATWAFERLKLVYNAAERWTELFELYDRVIEAQPDDESRQLILEDAVEVARDLAADQEHAIRYLEALFKLRPRDAKIDAQLERLYERQGKNLSLIKLLDSRLPRLDAAEAKAARFRVAGLWETSEANLVAALAAITALLSVEAGSTPDEEAASMVEGWLAKTAPALDAPAGSYRTLSKTIAGDAVRTPAARLLERFYDARGEEEKAIAMLEVLLESESDPVARARMVRQLSERKSRVGDARGALEATLAEVALGVSEESESDAIEAAVLAAAGDPALLGRSVDALREIGEAAADRARSLRILRRASTIARDELKDESRSITLDLAILSRSDEDPAGARAAARKLDTDLKATGREADRCAVLERLAVLEDEADARREALLEAARIAEEAIGDRARAIKSLRGWLEEEPGDVDVLTRLVDNLRALGDSKGLVEALEARSNATKESDEAESDRVEIARLYARVLDDRPRAIAAYRLAISKHGATDELVDELAEVLDADGRDADLADLLRGETKRGGGLAGLEQGTKERRASLFARLGAVEHRRGELSSALDAYVAALKLVPASHESQAGLESLLRALEPADPSTQVLFAAGVSALATSFEQAQQLERWLEIVQLQLAALKTDVERCELLLRAAKLEEDVAQDDVRALERTVEAFRLRPDHAGLAQALLERGTKTGRWELTADALLPALSLNEIDAAVARDLLVCAAEWASEHDQAPLSEPMLAVAHQRVPDDQDVLERLIALRRTSRGRPLVEALLALAGLRPNDLELSREALTTVLRDLGDEASAIPIAEQVVARAAERLRGSEASADAEAEDALRWAIEVLEPLWTASKETDRLRAAYVAAASLPIDVGRARSYLVLAAKLASPDEAVALYERLYAGDPNDLEVAEGLAVLYGELGRKADLARLYGRMAEGAASLHERARLRLLQAELLVDLATPDQAIGVLRQSIGEVGTHEPTVALLSSLLSEKKAFGDLCALYESQADLSKRADAARALHLYRSAADLADGQLKDVNRAARAYRRVAELDPSRESLDKFASLLERSRLYDEESQVLERLIEAHGREDDLSLRLAAAYGHAGKVERAREELERAIAQGGASPRVREVLASIYRGAGAWQALAELYETEADEATDEGMKVGRLRDAAQVFIAELGRPEDAVRLLQQAAELRPGDLDGVLVLSSALRAAGQVDEARERLGKLIAEFGARKPKERALVHFELAKVALAAKDRALALTELDHASKIDPAHAGVLQLLGEIALEEGQFLRAQRTYRGLLLVLRAQRGGAAAEGFFSQKPVYKSQVFVELAYIAERQKDADRKAEFVESAFEAARESAAEATALVVALDRRGYHDLVARALNAQLEGGELDADTRADIELKLAELYGKKLGRPAEAAELALKSFTRALETGDAAPSPLQERIAGLLKDLGKNELMYDALRDRAAIAPAEERVRLLGRAAVIAEAHLKDDARAADSLEGLLEAWSDTGEASAEQRAQALSRLDVAVGRLVAAGGAPADRHARVLEQVIDLVSAEGGSFADAADASYRLLEIYVAGEHVDSAYAVLERAVREDPDGDRVDGKLRDAMQRCAGDNRFVRLLEDFGRERGRGRAVVDALETLAERATDPSGHLKEAYEASLELEDPALTERLLRRIVPASDADDTADVAWAIVDLAERRFGASDAREAAALWERAAKVSDPDEERALLVRVADLADRILADTDRAIAILERLRQREPADRELWAPLAAIHSRRGDTESLAQLMDETIPLVDDLKERANLRLSLAKMLEVTDPDRAADILAEAIDEDPANRDSASLLERLYESTGRDDRLAILLERQLDVAKDEEDKARVVALYLRIAALRERLGEQDAALDAYHGALDWEAENVSALRAAVRLHTEREDSIVMGDLLDRLLELETGDEAAAIALKVADVKLSSGDPVGAERALVVGFKGNPRNADLKKRLVGLYSERSDAVGLARIRAAEARLLEDPAARKAAILEAAETIKNEGDAREASELYSDAFDLDPSDRDILFFFMETCANSNQQQRAIGAVDRVLAREPNDPWLLFSRAVLREAVGESDTALDDLEAAFDKSGGQYANELRAHLEAALGRIARDPGASKRSEEAIRLRLAEVSAFGGDVESARAVVEELLQRSPQNAAAVAAMGRIEELSGRPEAAALTYARAGRARLRRGGRGAGVAAVRGVPQDRPRGAVPRWAREGGPGEPARRGRAQRASRGLRRDGRAARALRSGRRRRAARAGRRRQVRQAPRGGTAAALRVGRGLDRACDGRARAGDRRGGEGLETERSGLAPADLRGARRARSRRRSAGRARADDRCTPRQALQGARTALLLALSGRVQGRQPLGGARGAVEGAR